MTADADKKIAELKLALLPAIERERAQQILFVRTLRDAAILAGEQVQDVRLDLLGSPPRASGDGVMIDIFVSLALGPVASAAIKTFANVGVRAVLALRVPLAKKNGAYSLAPFSVDSLKSADRFLARTKRVNLARDKEQLAFWSKIVEDIGGELKNVATNRSTKREAPPSAALGGDTAGVAVRRAAMHFARMQERTLERQFDAYSSQVNAPSTTLTELDALSSTLLNVWTNRIFNDPGDNEGVEQKLSLFFEACIWLLHFGGSGGIVNQATEERPALTNLGPYGVVASRQRVRDLRTDRAIVQYWLARLPHPRGNGRISFIRYESGLTPVTHADEARAATALLKWFSDLEQGLAETQKSLGALGLEMMGPPPGLK